MLSIIAQNFRAPGTPSLYVVCRVENACHFLTHVQNIHQYMLERSPTKTTQQCNTERFLICFHSKIYGKIDTPHINNNKAICLLT